MSRLFLAPAAKDLYVHNYEPSTVTSIDFADLLPILSFETTLKDSFDSVNGQGLVRLAPQIFPCYGKAYIKHAAFFVPKHQLFEDADAFHQKQRLYKGKAVFQPWIYSDTITQFLAGNTDLSTLVTQTATPTGSNLPAKNTFDFVTVIDNSGSPIYKFWRLTPRGKRVYKVYKLLGYDFVDPPYYSNISYTSAFNAIHFKIPAVTILAYAKVYVDMFLSGSAYNSDECVALLHAIHDKESYSIFGMTQAYDASTGMITAAGLSQLLQIRLPHSPDMYTQSWNTVNSPEGINIQSSSTGTLEQNAAGLMSPVYNITSSVQETQRASAFSNSLSYSSGGNITSLSANGLRLLNAFDKFVRRWNLSGTKAVQRVYAQFGIKPDDFNAHFVHKLSEGSERIQFSPVLSNSDTVSSGTSTGKGVGDYAGFGVSGLNVNFNYKSTDYGVVIVLAWLQIKPMILHGFDPKNLKMFAEDYFTPEYDGQAYRAIPLCEISRNKKLTDNNINNNGNESVFGYTNIYDEYRHMKDNIAGDFINSYVKDFLFCRDFSVLREDLNSKLAPQTNVVHYWDNADNPDISDPFQTAWSNGDRFWLYFDWNIKAHRPMLSDSDSYDLGTGDVDIEKNGDLMS